MDQSRCEFFKKVEVDYDVTNGHSSYRCFCTRHCDEREIVPGIQCKRCSMLKPLSENNDI